MGNKVWKHDSKSNDFNDSFQKKNIVYSAPSTPVTRFSPPKSPIPPPPGLSPFRLSPPISALSTPPPPSRNQTQNNSPNPHSPIHLPLTSLELPTDVINYDTELENIMNELIHEDKIETEKKKFNIKQEIQKYVDEKKKIVIHYDTTKTEQVKVYKSQIENISKEMTKFVADIDGKKNDELVLLKYRTKQSIKEITK